MPAKQPLKIMLVDDDEDFLHLLAMRLHDSGFETCLALDGNTALTKLQTFRPQLVVTDLRMAGMDGMALFENIRRHHAFLPVIIMTAHGSIPEAVDATRKGVFSFLTKPLKGRDLITEIERALSLAGSPAAPAAGPEQNSWRQQIISQSPIMEDLLAQARLVAESNSNVFIQGQSGTGKELLAKAIHQASPRAKQPFIAVNCGAIPETLLESELFGHVRGSFTGAVRDHQGLIRAAEGGSLFLDEIGDTPPAFQVKLLRVIQERNLRPLGATAALDIDVRFISATHRDIQLLVEQGAFREDLYYRLNVALLKIPSLARRREDIPLLCQHYLREITRQSAKKVNGFSPEAMELLLAAPWPGNIRQLYNVIEHSVALATGPIISTDLVQQTMHQDFSSTDRHDSAKMPSLAEARQRFEQEYIVNLMQMTKGNVSQAARIAQKNRTDFYKILHRNHILPSLFKAAVPAMPASESAEL